ncbi:MAG: segregation/condensation protein A [Patescibacteria group bacterium]
MQFNVAQEVFSGPLELLLELIESDELEITQVSLAKVAEGYLQYLEEHEVPADELADFLLVASRLIYLKSRELMPYLRIADEDEGVDKLQDQLRLYREYAAAARELEERYLKARMYVRPFVKMSRVQEVAFAPATNVTTLNLMELYKIVLKRLQPFFALQQASMERTKSVEERLEELTEALRSKATMSFKEVIIGAGSKMEVVVSFLALLELLRRRAVRAEQTGSFADIQLKRVS